MHRILLLLLAACAGNAHALGPDGTLDTDFGTSGHTKAVFDGVDASVGGLVSTGANRTFMVGTLAVNNSNATFLLARLATDTGLLDPTLGPDGNGMAMTELPAGLRAPEIHVVTKQANGLVLAAGTLDNGTAVDPAFVCRFFTAGNLDTNFGTDGCKTIRTFLVGEQICRARGVAVDTSGNIVVSGYCEGAPPFARPFIARLTSTGALDVEFAGGAGVATPLLTMPGYSTEQRFEAVLVAPDGKIAVAMTARHNVGDNDMGIARFTDGGTFDTSFNGIGARMFFIDLGDTVVTRNDYANDLVRRDDGRLVLVGRSRYLDLKGKITIASVLANGADDAAFGTESVAIDDNDLSNVFAAGSWLTARRMRAVLDHEDRLIVSAFEFGSQGDEDDVVRRYLADGSADPRFGNAGTVTIDHQVSLGGPARTHDFSTGVLVSGSRILVASSARRPIDDQEIFVAYALANGDIFRDSFE